MACAVGQALTDRGLDMNYTRVLSAARARRSALRRRPIALGEVLMTCLLGLMAGVTHAQSAPPQIDPDEIGGVVKSALGPEAGVWVIAETNDFATRFAKIVVTDDQGRYLVPDLPKANYRVWVRGYGLADSTEVRAVPGSTLDLTAVVAPDAATAAKVYPAAYWYAMLKVPDAAEVAHLPGGRNAYLMWIKNMGCIGCHQLGNLATRTLPTSLGKFDSSQAAWARRIQSGQAGGLMMRLAEGLLGGIPLKYLADWTDRIAAGELPAAKPARPAGLERNVVATVRDWADPQSYVHDLSGTDRRHPTVNGNGPLFGSPELSTDNFPILDPIHNVATTFKAPVRDADTPTTRDDAVVAPSPYWGTQRIWDSKANAHNPMFDSRGRVWYTARIRAADNPAFCKKGSTHPSARLFPTERSDRQLAVYEPKSGKYTFIDTCFGPITYSLPRTRTTPYGRAAATRSSAGSTRINSIRRAMPPHRRVGHQASSIPTATASSLSGPSPDSPRTRVGTHASRSASMRSCLTPWMARSGARSRFATLAQSCALIRARNSPKSTTFRRRALVCAALTSIATASSGSRSAAAIWVASTAANAECP
jgi:hypothetical protein